MDSKSSCKCAWTCLSQVKSEELPAKVTTLQGDLKAANKLIETLRTQLTLVKSEVRACERPSATRLTSAEFPCTHPMLAASRAASLLDAVCC